MESRRTESEWKSLINGISFDGLEHIQLGDALHYELRFDWNSKMLGVKSLLRCVYYFCTKRIKFRKDDTVRFLLLFSNSYGTRMDLYALFKRVTELVEDKLLVVPGKKTVCISRFKHMKEIAVWLRKMKSEGMSWTERMAILSVVLRNVCDYWDILRYIEEHQLTFDAVTVLCDAHAIDSILVQYYNGRNVDTVSLQHGMMSVEGDNPWHILGSKSKYYLSYGVHTQEQFLLGGHSEEKNVLVGMPKFIGKDLPNKVKRNQTGVFSVILCGFSIDEESNLDTQILAVAKAAAELLDMDYIIKMHPGHPINQESPLVDSKRIKGMYTTEVSVQELMEVTDFAIMSSSTVFIEYMMDLFPTFLYREPGKNKYYAKITWSDFSKAEELQKLVQRYFGNAPSDLQQRMQETREYLSVSDDVAGKYRAFYERYGSNK